MTVLAVAHLANVTGLVADEVVNQLVLDTPAGTIAGDVAGYTLAIANLWNELWDDQISPLSDYISEEISRDTNACTVRFYDLAGHLDGSSHGVPIAMGAFTMGAAGSSESLPGEVAFAVTLEGEGRSTALVETADADVPADAKRDRPQSRRTGRLYVGSLNKGASDLGSPCRPTTNFRNDAMFAVLGLHHLLMAADQHLCVWSRKNAEIYVLEAVSSDDAWDTQRRRGVDKTARVRLSV